VAATHGRDVTGHDSDLGTATAAGHDSDLGTATAAAATDGGGTGRGIRCRSGKYFTGGHLFIL
jgi:hypothetical protein